MKFSSTLSEELREKYKRRSVRLRVGDSVRIVKGEFKGIEGKVTKVGPGSMMYCAANRLHGIVNTGNAPLLFYFHKWQA